LLCDTDRDLLAIAKFLDYIRTNRPRRWATSLIETNALPLSKRSRPLLL